MIRLAPHLALALLMAPTAATAVDDQLRATRLDAALQVVASDRWPAGGRLLGPALVLPGGDVAAVVEGPSGRALCRWSPTGAPRGRHPLSLDGEVRALRPVPGDALVVVTSAELVRVALADGKVLARRRHGLALDESARVAGAPQGAWAAFPERLVYVPLDGPPIEKALPLAPGAEAYRADRGLPLGDLVVTDEGACLLSEYRVARHPVSGRPDAPDKTRELLLSLLSPRGELLGQRALGTASSYKEWFWAEHGPDEIVLPSKMGLVRTRWKGAVGFWAGTARPGGDLVLLLAEEGNDRMVRVDGRLAERWSRPYALGPPGAISGSWAPGVAVHDGAAVLLACDEQGGAERTVRLGHPPGADRAEAPRGRVLGPAPGGGWLVVEY